MSSSPSQGVIVKRLPPRTHLMNHIATNYRITHTHTASVLFFNKQLKLSSVLSGGGRLPFKKLSLDFDWPLSLISTPSLIDAAAAGVRTLLYFVCVFGTWGGCSCVSTPPLPFRLACVRVFELASCNRSSLVPRARSCVCTRAPPLYYIACVCSLKWFNNEKFSKR